MLGRILLIVLAGVGLVGVVILGRLALHSGEKPAVVAQVQGQKVPTVAVLVARQALHAGALLQSGDLQAREFPTDLVPAGAIHDMPSERVALTGGLLRVPVPAGGLLTNEAVLRVGDHGFLAAVLKPGDLAVSVGVDVVAGVAGLIEPGDYVDLIVTHDVATVEAANGGGNAGGNEGRIAAETVLSALRVVAIDHEMLHTSVAEDRMQSNRTVTLEVTPAEAEAVAVAGRLGRLSLAVRSLAQDRVAVFAPHTTWGDEVSPALAHGPDSTSQTLHLYNGTADLKDVHF
jgi:pilus assembly protein CpaB